MAQYKFLKKKTFEKLEDFENRINETAQGGWQVLNFQYVGSSILVLFEKNKHT